MALRVCVDASRKQGGPFAIAGVAFGYDRAAKANSEWKRLMKGRTFHMTDLHARQGDFAGISDDEKRAIMVGIVRILKSYASFFGAVSCDETLVSEPYPKASSPDRDSQELRNAFRSPYGVMCHLCMSVFGVFAEERSPRGLRSISYILERGDEGQRGLMRFMEFMRDQPVASQLMDLYSLSGITTASKDEMEPVFHAADFLAWEWARHVKDQQNGNPIRRSLAELTCQQAAEADYFGMTLGREKMFLFRHLDLRHMDRFVRMLRAIIEAKTPADVTAVISDWEDTRFV